MLGLFDVPPPDFSVFKRKLKGKRSRLFINFRKPEGKIQNIATKPYRCKRISIRKRLINFINKADDSQIQTLYFILREQNAV